MLNRLRARLLHQAVHPRGPAAAPAGHQPRRRDPRRDPRRVRRGAGLLPAPRVLLGHPRHHRVRVLRHPRRDHGPARRAARATGAPTSTPRSTGSATRRSSAAWCSGTPATAATPLMAGPGPGLPDPRQRRLLRQGARRGAGHDRQRRHRRARRPAGRGARGDRTGRSRRCPRSCSPSCSRCWPSPAWSPWSSGCSTVRRQALEPRREARSPATSSPSPATGSGGRRVRRLPERAAYAPVRPASPTSTVARGGVGRAAAAGNYARVRPELGRRGAGRPRPRRACAPTCATAARPSGCRTAAPRRSRRQCPGRGRRRRCARSSPTGRAVGDASSATSATGTPPAPGGPRELGPGHDRGRAAQARGAVRRVPRLPRVARHDDPPAHRRRRRLRASCAATSRGRVIVPLLADRDLTARGVEVDLCGHRAGWRPARPRSPWQPGPRCTPCRSTTSAADGTRVAAPCRHHLPRAGRRCPATGTTRARATADDPGLRRRARRRDPRAHRRTGTCCSGCSSTTTSAAAGEGRP